MCQPRVPFTAQDMALGKDRICQGTKKAIKTADGRVCYVTYMTPTEAAEQGIQLGRVFPDKICPI